VGEGIPASTKVTAVGAGSLTLSNAATANTAATALFAYSECTNSELACTFDVSAPECSSGGECGNPASKADAFVTATPSGNVAFFTSCAKLTDASAPQGGCISPLSNFGLNSGGEAKLYRWERNGVPGHRLTDLTVDKEPGDGVQPNFRQMVGASEDGNIVYFVTQSQLISGEPTTAPEKLYRWEWNGGNPTIEYIGPYQSVSARWNGTGPANVEGMLKQVTPDGKYLLIYTALRLDPVADSDQDVDAYRWDETDGWVCVSCQQPGVKSAGDVSLDFNLWLHGGILPSMQSSVPRTTMSEDGQHIFFATPDALVPGDVNGEGGCPLVAQVYTSEPACQDVYEWHDGRLGLVSSGTGSEPVRLLTATESGRDVLFLTRQQLVGWDADKNVDVYDARVGGGFAEPLPQPPSCEAESCRGEPSISPKVPGAGTGVFEGPSNIPDVICPKGSRKVTVKGQKTCKTRKKHHHLRKKRHHRRAHR
jgi:hypothetical protein